MNILQVCKRCVMDSTDSTIIFNEEGLCNYCSDVLKRKNGEYYPNEEGKKKLDAIMQETRKKGEDKKYDCIVGISGGIDSTYVLYLGYKYGLRMMGVNIDDGLGTALTKQNIKKYATQQKRVLQR